MPNKSQYLDGMQEVTAKTSSFVFTTLLYLVYVSARTDMMIALDPVKLLSFLALFWFLYELFSFILYTLFNLFFNERNKKAKTEETKPRVN